MNIANYKFPCALLLLILASCFLTACDKGNRNVAPIKEIVKKYDQETFLEGIVSNNDGPVKVGAIKVTDANGRLITEAMLQNNGHYRVAIPANTVLPIILNFYPAAADAQKLVTAVVHPSITKYDINPLTTSIAQKALAMGGYTHAQLVRAAESAATVPDANKNTAGFRGDPTTQYGGWH